MSMRVLCQCGHRSGEDMAARWAGGKTKREQILERCTIRWILDQTCVLAFTHLIDNPACDAHAIKNSHIDNGGHSPIVDGLRAVRPHVRTLGQVNVAGRQAGRRDGGMPLTVGQFLS